MTAPIGLSVKRREDRRFLTGRGRFVDDVRLPRLVHAAIVRSPHAHARVVEVEARRARALPGVVAILTIADLPECAAAVPPLVATPKFRAYAQPAIAGPKVRHAGEAVAVVVADDAYGAADAADAVEVRYETLPSVATVEAALAPGAERVFDEWPDNVAGPSTGSVGDVTRGFAQAHTIVEGRLSVPRVAAVPIEPRGIVAQPDAPDGRLTVWTSTQVPFAVRAAIAAALGLAEEQVRVIAPDVGGGFGAKGHVYPEDVLIAAVARRLGRSVKWIELRREHFLATAPDRDQHHQARLGVAKDGTITAIETTFTRDSGAYPVIGDVISLNTINHLPGPYRVANLKGTALNVVTHKSFTAAYRGAGRPEGAYVLDRLLDRAARGVGLDPAELRRRNLIRPDEMPFATGLRYRDGVPIVYDPADYHAAFDRLLDRFGYGEWRSAQQARGSTMPIGIGLSAYLEGTGIGPFEGADVRIDPSGTIYLQIGVSSQGQAHETTLAQVCAAELGVDTDRVVVVGGDTAVLGYGNGTIASRVAAVAGPAVQRTSREVARKARLVAAEMLECAPADVVLAQGVAHVTGLAERRVELGALARASLRSPTLLREGAPGLHACAFFRPETVTWAFGAHACAVEVDVETGALRLLRYAAVHDCGRPLNPMVVEGQLHGGIVQGIGAALAEELIYDGDGQLLTGSLMEYGVPRADQVPALDVIALDFPSTRNEMGIKGVGESGIISPVPAIANAVEDALISRGAEVSRVPLTAASVWEALRRASTHRGPSRV
jgi:aerobic carbon-monoxide dehydrogenase large subunit